MNSLDKKMKLRMNKERKPIPMNELAHSLINSDERIPIQEEKRERLRFRLSSNLISLFTQIRIRLAHRYAHSSSWSPRGSRSLMRIRKLTGRRAKNQCAWTGGLLSCLVLCTATWVVYFIPLPIGLRFQAHLGFLFLPLIWESFSFFSFLSSFSIYS